MLKDVAYVLPKDIEESIQELLRLKKTASQSAYSIANVIAYKNQMELLLTDLKIAALDGEISQSVFEELVWEYQVL
jgi:hypothetical protein